MLSVKDLHVSVEGNEILKGLSLDVKRKSTPLWGRMVPVKVPCLPHWPAGKSMKLTAEPVTF